MNRTIAYITDIHLDETFVIGTGVDPRANWKIILDDIRERNIDTIFFGGDIGEATANSWFFESLQPFHIQITLGNHDTFAEVSKHFTKGSWVSTTEGYYTQEDAHFKYLFLDSSKDALNGEQLMWLAKELLTSKKVLLFIHHPILAIETAVDKAYPLQDREKVKQLIQQRNEHTTIFCGHYHMLDERKEHLVQQYVTPAASYQIVKEAEELTIDTSGFGYRLIHFNDTDISTALVWFKHPKSSI